jgi:hypothetical protein
MRPKHALLCALVAGGIVATASRAPAAAAAPAPKIYGIFPNTGSSGEPVIIFGHGFDRNRANDALTFNNVAATVSFASRHILFAEVPAGLPLGVVNVALVVSGQASNVVTFTVVAPTPPVISAIVSTSGPPFSPVRIKGTGLGNVGHTFFGNHFLNKNDFVSFGATDTHFAFFTPTEVFTLVPPQLAAGMVQVGVTVNGLASNTLPFDVTAPQQGAFGQGGFFGGGGAPGGGGPFSGGGSHHGGPGFPGFGTP